MALEFTRADRVASTIKRELGQIIQLELKDPRVHMASITAVTMTRDLAYAKIYMSFLEDDPLKIKENLQILTKAAGFLRAQLSKRVKLRVLPELNFVYDVSVTEGERLANLIDKVDPDKGKK